MASAEKEIIDLYKLSLKRNIKYYDKKLQSMKDKSNEKMYQDILQEKTMTLYCLQLLEKWERVLYSLKRSC